nr:MULTISPECIES: methyltransferase domain-containing protein [unclassified Xanthobacter]
MRRGRRLVVNNLAKYREKNRAAWNEATTLHLRNPNNPLGRVLQGGCSLARVEREELGDVRGRRLIHLLCNCGHDTLSLARLGARCTGVDIADEAIAAARSAAAVLGLPVRFIRSDVYDLALDEHFDIVYVGKGALYWLDDFAEFARIVARLLAPGGRVYVYEEHSLLPFMLELDPTAYNPASGDLNYFHDVEPTSSVGLDYVGLSGEGTKRSYEWQWTLGDIVTGFAQAGLRIEFLHEWPFISSFKYWDWLEEREDEGAFHIPADKPQLPLSFSLQARRD